MTKATLSTQPYRGTHDLIGENLKEKHYIFNIWRKVSHSFGYEEYLTPLLEPAEIYEAKSGEDVGQKELYTLTDKGDRRLAIRPEMTPSVTRLVSQFYSAKPKPIRLFSIANFMRYERPQSGRNREFWQLNLDLFGETSPLADLEILTITLGLMQDFNATADMFTIYVNDRRLINEILTKEIALTKEQITPTVRLMDKYDKLTSSDFKNTLKDQNLTNDQIKKITTFLNSTPETLTKNFPNITKNEGYQSLLYLLKNTKSLPLSQTIKFNPALIRGFDYYDGFVFEVFDKDPNNNRSLFGGGRYNGLANLFGKTPIPAVGFAPGDETLHLFLKNHHLFPPLPAAKTVYLPILQDNLLNETLNLANRLRINNVVITGASIESPSQAITKASQLKTDFIIFYGEREQKSNTFTLKNLESGEQNTLNLTDLLSKLK